MDIDEGKKASKATFNDSKFVSLFTNKSGLKVGMEDRKQKKKYKIVPISVKSKIISKGGSYNDKLEIRKLKGQVGKTSCGAAKNKLGQKRELNLRKVPGIALTKKQKKALLKQRAKEAARKGAQKEDEDLVSSSEVEDLENTDN